MRPVLLDLGWFVGLRWGFAAIQALLVVASVGTPSYEPPSLDRAEWERIQRVLADAGGNITKAARSLGIHRRTLQRKLDRSAPRR